MIEAAMIWNEPNNKSHWDPEIDPDWSKFADMAIQAARAIRQANPQVKRVLGGISPIDPFFIERMRDHGVLELRRSKRWRRTTRSGRPKWVSAASAPRKCSNSG